MQRVWRNVEVLAPVTGPGVASDEADLLEEAGHPAHGAAARMEPLGEHRRRLLRGLADGEVGPHAPGHRRHARAKTRDAASMKLSSSMIFTRSRLLLSIMFSQY